MKGGAIGGFTKQKQHSQRYSCESGAKTASADRQLTEGVVKDILTSSPVHPRGIKVRLLDGTVGRVQEILHT